MTATLSPSEREVVRRALVARESPLAFAQYVTDSYMAAPHLEAISRELQALDAGDNKRLMVFMPPRHGKSLSISVYFPAWYIARHPERSLILTSYGDILAHGFGRQARNVFDDERARRIFPRARLASDTKAANLWRTTAGGQLLATSIGSGITGHGGHGLIIDDPIKSRAEAESETYRAHNLEWYKAEARTRLEPGGWVVIVETRWHEADLAGTLLEEEGRQEEGGAWRVLELPAIDARGRALWPERFDLEELGEIRREIGEREWAPLYMQRPTPAEGAVFKWWPRYREAPAPTSIVMPIDTAYSGEGDWWAWSVWGKAGGLAYLLDADRVKADAPEAERHFTMAYRKVQQQYPHVPVKVLHRARVAIDKVAAQHLRRGVASIDVMSGGTPRREGLPVVEVKLPAGNTKEELGAIVSSEFEGGRALIPERAGWLEPWLDEHKGFPAAMHDDWVEGTVIAMWYLFRAGDVKRRPPRRIMAEGW